MGVFALYFLSIDFGTSAVKLSAVDENGTVKAWAKEPYPYILLPGEKSEIAPSELTGALFRAAGKLWQHDSSLSGKIGMICYDTFSPSPVFMDKDGNLTYPNIITHMDRRSRAESEDVEKIIGKDAYMNISGIYPFPGGCSAMTFLWFLKNQPEVYEKTERVGHLTTYIHHFFTGEWMVDLVNASMMGLYETTTQGGWSKELLSAFGLSPSLFGDIHNPGTVLGSLLPEIAAKLGVKAGIPVTVGTNDVAVAHMGAGNSRSGEMMDTAGSSEMISILTDTPAVNPHYYLRNAVLPGLWQIYSTTAGGFAVDWFYKEFCREMTEEEFYGRYILEAVEKNLQNRDISFAPYLTGDRQSLQKKTASFEGLTLASTRDQMLAALLRAMQGVLRTTIEEAKEVIPLSGDIKISGGMVTAPYLKLKALEIPGFSFTVVDDCPILGNVALARRYMK